MASAIWNTRPHINHIRSITNYVTIKSYQLPLIKWQIINNIQLSLLIRSIMVLYTLIGSIKPGTCKVLKDIETKRNETKSIETILTETKLNKIEQNEIKFIDKHLYVTISILNYSFCSISFHFVSVFVSFRFDSISFPFVSFRFDSLLFRFFLYLYKTMY